MKTPFVMVLIAEIITAGLCAGTFCASQRTNAAVNSQADQTRSSDDEIVLERRTEGIIIVPDRFRFIIDDPSYTVTVRRDGNVLYQGNELVRVKGRVHARINKELAQKLFDMANAMDFFSAQQVFNSGCLADGNRTAIVTVKELQRQRILVEDGCSHTEGLGQLADEIDNVTQTVQWTRWVFPDAGTLERLIRKGDVGVAKDGESYMLGAIERDAAEIIRVLIKHGFDVNKRGTGDTWLMRAVDQNKARTVAALLASGANPTGREANGETPAVRAAYHGAAMVKIFLDRNSSVKHADAHGGTMLMAAATAGDLECVQLILQAGANVNARDKRGQTAIGLAEDVRDKYHSPHPEKLNAVIDYLVRNGGVR